MQTAFAALCYFCENHGPRIVFTCQLMKNSELKLEAQGHNHEHQQQKQTSSGSFTDDEIPQFYDDFYGEDEIIDDELRCAACSSFDQGMGMLSNNYGAEVSFISTQVPINERLNQILKQASLRSLSVEISAPLHTDMEENNHSDDIYINNERDGIVLFGDDENWYTLSYTFRLKDAKARGFHRSYSLVVVCMDKLLLLRNYDFLVHKLYKIVAKLQDMTNSFFELEQENDSDLRLATNVKGAHWLPHHFFPKQYTLDTSRSLKIIANNVDIFIILHRQMLGLLKMLTALDKDIVLEGCPTQDMLTIMEINSSGSLEEKELLAQLTPKLSLVQVENLRFIAENFKCTDPLLLDALIWQVVIGGQVVVRSDSLIARRSFLLALVQLLPIGCVNIAANSPQYYYQYKYNFLGCSVMTKIPEDIQSEIFLINISKRDDGNIIGNIESDIAIEAADVNCLKDTFIAVEYYPSRNVSLKPTIVSRYTQLLFDPLVNDFTLDSAIKATKNDWLNNAKLIFQLRHQRQAIDLDRILRIIKCKTQDSPVILFWQKGLSNRYRQVILHTLNESSTSNCG